MSNDNWISVEDRLPKEMQNVRWLCNNGIEDIGWFYHGNFQTFDARTLEAITHWMPLLPLPQEEKDFTENSIANIDNQ